MKKQCHNCRQCTPQMFDGKPQIVSRCVHVSFLKAGLGKANPVAGKPPEVRFDHMSERLPEDTILQNHAEGFYYHDHIDIKSKTGRVCAHWTSPLGLADDILATYNFSWDYVRNFPDLHPALVAWIDEGRPQVEKEYPKLNRIQRWDYTGKDVPDAVIEAYEACGTCRHYKMDVDANGAPVPFRGTCWKNTVSSNGIFSLGTDQETPVVFSFMGCGEHSVKENYNNKDAPDDLPQRLTIFVETNPLDLSVEQYAMMYRFPTVTRTRAVEQEQYDALMETDLVATLRQRHGDVDFNAFSADMGLDPVEKFFSRGIKQSHAHAVKKWKQFEHYKTADDLLFEGFDGTPAEETSDAPSLASQLHAPPLPQPVKQEVDK